jgi:PAS domain S-box-containing protein
LFGIGIALPLLVMAVVLVNALVDAQRQGMRSALESSSKLIATLVDSELETRMTLVAALAQMQQLNEGNLEQFLQHATVRLQFLHGAWLNVTTPDGKVVATTLEGVPLAEVPDSDHETRTRAVRTGRPEVSDLLSRGAGREPVAFVSIAVPGTGANPVYVLSVSVLPSRLAAIISGKFEPDVLVAVLDRPGRFVARVPDHALRVGTFASQSWLDDRSRSQSGLVTGQTVEGFLTLLSYRPTMYGWTVGVAYKRNVVEAPYAYVRRTILAIALTLIVAGAFLISLLSRRITRPAKQLLEAASRLADMRPVHNKPTGVAEFDVVIHHFARVAEKLREREQALRQSEQRFRTALEAGEAGTWTWDTRTDLRSLDARNREILGWSMDESVDTAKLMAHIHPDDQEAVRKAMSKAIDPSGDGTFRVEYRVRTSSGDERWVISQARARFAEDGSASLVGIIRDITHRKLAEQKIRFLMREAVHRTKNLLAVVQSISNRTALTGDPATFLPRLVDRLEGLSASQDLLVASEWIGVGLAALIEAHLAGQGDLVGERILLDGPPVRLRPEAVQSIGMALHELATNAIKYGALTNGNGKVAITWGMTSAGGSPRFFIEWRETGGPPAPAPEYQGFGHIVIGRMIESALKGKVTLQFLPEGLLWRVEADPALTLDTVWPLSEPVAEAKPAPD